MSSLNPIHAEIYRKLTKLYIVQSKQTLHEHIHFKFTGTTKLVTNIQNVLKGLSQKLHSHFADQRDLIMMKQTQNKTPRQFYY